MGNINFEDTLLDMAGNGVTGSTGLGIIVRRVADDFLLDFNDGAFKNAAWVTKRQAMAEVDAVELPGSYELSVAVTAWNDGGYIAYFAYDGSDVGLTKYRVPSGLFVFDGEEAEASPLRLSSTIDGTLGLQKALKVLLALSVAKRVDVAGAVYTFQDQSGVIEVTATYGANSTTVVITP